MIIRHAPEGDHHGLILYELKSWELLCMNQNAQCIKEHSFDLIMPVAESPQAPPLF